jgi:HPt (histidine-containing phosphotransfer) domain-containing protein/HAMP domain-containing protein
VRAHRLSSVASKMAGATLALIVVVTAGISFQLSRYQRENLLRAKEASASAVIRLFADSCAAAVVFNDPADLRETLATLGRNEDIDYAAVWAVGEDGRVGQQLAELMRGRAEQVTRVPTTLELRRDRDRVVPMAPVRNVKGQVVGVLVAGFSLARENDAIARLEKTALLISAGVAAGLTLLLMALSRLLVVGPLGKLVNAAKRLEDGRGANIDVRSNDEVGQLATALRSMASAIQVREERISARNRDMRLVLDNAGQGFITLDICGTMSEERSRIVDQWFGSAEGTPKFWEYLRQIDVSLGDYFEVGWSAVIDQILPMDLCLDQLPRVARKGGRTFEMAYQPIMKADVLDKTIVIITDITVRLERERSEQRQRDTMNIYRRLIADRHAFDEFFDEASNLVSGIAASSGAEPLYVIKRHVHTLKGNCALFGIESVATLCHAIEDRIDDMAALAEGDRTQLRSAWETVRQIRGELLDTGSEGRVGVSHEDYEKLLTDLRRHANHETLAATVEAWEYEPAATRLALVREQIEGLAGRLDRAAVDVICQPTSLRLPPRRWGRFWSAFAHVVRNTVDHGVETGEKRAAAHKPPRATITIGVNRTLDQVVVSIEDDGPGIDWALIAERARERSMPADTRRDLESALFTDGISSRAKANNVSGRGVGLGAIRAVVRELGGRLELTSDPGHGTTLRCWLPGTMLSGDRSPATDDAGNVAPALLATSRTGGTTGATEIPAPVPVTAEPA